MGFLSDLVQELRAELDARPPDRDALEAAAAARPPAQDLTAALVRSGVPAVIAEVKRASPSAGDIAGDADPVRQARAYADGGAAAISVLTERTHFRGSLEDLLAIREAVPLPLLRKDFIVRSEQIAEARAAGADSVLLITSCLTEGELTRLLADARAFGMEPLVETHDDDDLDRALATDARVLGVNARDLETLEVDVDRAVTRLRRIPADRVAVFESGVRVPADAAAAVAAGASAILVGEALMRAEDPAEAIRALRRAGSAPRGSADRRDMREAGKHEEERT